MSMIRVLTFVFCALASLEVIFAFDYNASAVHKENKISATIVQSYVYCQNCNKHWGRHLAGAEIGIECRENEGRRQKLVAQGKGISNAKGYVEIKLPAYDYKKNYHRHTCLVRILRSLDASCDYRTNINNGYSGARPTFSKIMADQTAYFSTPYFAFTPMCNYV